MRWPGTRSAGPGGGFGYNDKQASNAGTLKRRGKTPGGFKAKDLMGLPWRVAFALQDAGWYLRRDIVWQKSNPMPDSAKDRPASSHEFIFLLSKKARYFYDDVAVKQPASGTANPRTAMTRTPAGWDMEAGSHSVLRRDAQRNGKVPGVGPKTVRTPKDVDGRSARLGRAPGWRVKQNESCMAAMVGQPETRNLRDVWTFATQQYGGEHFATFPELLAELCMLAGTGSKGCCETCGTPWARETDRQRMVDGEPVDDLGTMYRPGGDIGRASSAQGIGHYRISTKVTTTGWRATCDCNAPTSPCIVLDPFAGAGTVGVVAKRHDRDAVLIEISPEYAAMAQQRVDAEPPTQLKMVGML